MSEPYDAPTAAQLGLIAETNPAPVLMLARARYRWRTALDGLRAASLAGDPVAFHDQCTSVADCRDAHDVVLVEVLELRRLTLCPHEPGPAR